MNYFSKELTQIRKQAGFSQNQLAKKSDLSRSYICRLENGERVPNKDLILKIGKTIKLDRYGLNKLFILADLAPDITTDEESMNIILNLALEFKSKGFINEAENLIKTGMKLFSNTIEINSLGANLSLIKEDYEEAITLNEKAIKSFNNLSKKELKTISISKAEVIHNLGNVYFERGKLKKIKREKLILEDWINNKVETENKKIKQLGSEIITDFDIAIEKIESAYKLAPKHEHIVDQLARLYFNRAELGEEAKKTRLFTESIKYYDKLINFQNKTRFENSSRLESLIFLSLAFAKIFDLTEASRLINTIITCKPSFYLGYYAKACIYSINGKNTKELLKVSYDNLKQALILNPDLKQDIIWEIDLRNLRFNKTFSNKFEKLCEK